MAPGYQGRIDDDEIKKHRHDALSGDEFNAGVESDNPQEDRRLKRELINKLMAHPELNVSGVKLNVKGGFVSITGMADNIDAKGTIEAIVGKTEGVLDVVNFLQLRKGFDTGDGHGLREGEIH